MKNTSEKILKMVELMGFDSACITVHVDEEYRKISLVIDDDIVRGNITPSVLAAFNHLFNQVLKKEGKPYYIVDLNYYRKERERLIIELTRAAARKAVITKQEVELPPMNAYERRLIHTEIATHPELVTQSTGEGKDRRVVIKRFVEEN